MTTLNLPSSLSARAALGLSGALLLLVGLTLLTDPVGYQRSMGVELPADPTLLSDLRAMGGGLVGFGMLLGLGFLRPTFAGTAATAGAVLYLSYGLARVASLWVDGQPADVLMVSAGIELAVGATLATVCRREVRRARALPLAEERSRPLS